MHLIIGFVRARRGGIAVLTALAMPVLLAFVALTSDLIKLADARSRLGNAADMAALAALTAPAVDSEAFALDRFQAEIARQLPEVMISSASVTIDDTNPTRRFATVAYNAMVPVFWQGILPAGLVSIAGQRQAKDGREFSHIDVHFLLDRSATMTLPEDPFGAPIIYETGCYFACHGVQDDPHTGFGNIETRLDVAKRAIRDITADLLASPSAQNLSLSVLTFDREVLTEVSHTQSAAAIGIALDNVFARHETNLNEAIRGVDSHIGPVGDGSGPNSRRQILIMISDGYHNRSSEPFNTNFCDGPKLRGVEIYTLYLPIRLHWVYHNRPPGSPYRDPLEFGGVDLNGYYHSPAPDAQKIMLNCASSPNHAYLANDDGDLETAATQILDSIINRTAHLSR